jgi:hypothetical protein
MQCEIFSEEEPLVSKHVIARDLGLNVATINAWARAFPNFPVIRLPGLNRFRKSAVARWIQEYQRPKKGTNV